MTSEMVDVELLTAAAAQLGCEVKLNATVKFFSGTAHGTVIQLAGWRYPIVVNSDGKVSYDNYEGRWGDIARLTELKQQYSAQAIMRQVRLSGGRLVHTSTEKVNNKIVLTIIDRG